MVISWMKGNFRMENLAILPMFEQEKIIEVEFKYTSYYHVFQDLNSVVDILLEEGLLMEANTISLM